MSAPTNADWLNMIADRCTGIGEPMPLDVLVDAARYYRTPADYLLRHALIHLARAHMDRDDQLERLRGKLGKIRDILDEE